MNGSAISGSVRMKRALPFLPLRATLNGMPNLQDMTDAELMQQYCRGHAAAFDELYARHRQKVFTFLLRHSQRDRAEVEEVFQESWLKVIRRRDSYDPGHPFLAWLYTIARSCLIDRWRHLGRVESLHVSNDLAMLGASSDGLAQPDRRAASEGINERWQVALADLPVEQREAILLHYESGMTLEEIGQVTDCGRETVKSRLRYAVRKLRGALADLKAEEHHERA